MTTTAIPRPRSRGRGLMAVLAVLAVIAGMFGGSAVAQAAPNTILPSPAVVDIYECRDVDAPNINQQMPAVEGITWSTRSESNMLYIVATATLPTTIDRAGSELAGWEWRNQTLPSTQSTVKWCRKTSPST